MDQMFVNIVSDERALAKENLKGNTELEWHIDKGYSENLPEYVALYSVDIDEDAGDTLFVSSRILEDLLIIIENIKMIKFSLIWIDLYTIKNMVIILEMKQKKMV